jgi:hypothetical protein
MATVNITGRDAKVDCPSVDIAAYIDGELTPDGELKLESHVADCSVCLEELNLQKQFVNALDLSLRDAPELPADFTKRVVANAESDVHGLRRRRERLDAIFVCAGLLLFVLFTLGAKAPGAFGAAADIALRFYAVVEFAAHLLYDISIGVVIILRSLAGQSAFTPVAYITFVALITGLSYKISQIRDGRRGLNQVESDSGI